MFADRVSAVASNDNRWNLVYFLHRESNMPVQAGKQLVEWLFNYKKNLSPVLGD